jgi:hypothetical protein
MKPAVEVKVTTVRRYRIPHSSIRRLVRTMPQNWNATSVRAHIRLCCDPKKWPADLIRQAEDYAVKVYRNREEAA